MPGSSDLWLYSIIPVYCVIQVTDIMETPQSMIWSVNFMKQCVPVENNRTYQVVSENSATNNRQTDRGHTLMSKNRRAKNWDTCPD